MCFCRAFLFFAGWLQIEQYSGGRMQCFASMCLFMLPLSFLVSEHILQRKEFWSFVVLIEMNESSSSYVMAVAPKDKLVFELLLLMVFECVSSQGILEGLWHISKIKLRQNCVNANIMSITADDKSWCVVSEHLLFWMIWCKIDKGEEAFQHVWPQCVLQHHFVSLIGNHKCYKTILQIRILTDFLR